MKATGGVILSGAILICIFLGLSPTHVHVLGTDGSCGAPIANAFQPISHDSFGLEAECRQQSRIRLVEAAGVFLTVGVIGGIMLSFGPSAATKDRKRYEQWRAWQEQEEYARQWEAYQRELAEWERQHGQPPQGPPLSPT